MPFVFYTNQEFPIGKTFQTTHLSADNWRAMEAAGPQAVEVEEFLEAVRRESFPDAPPRMESISAVPWPEMGPSPDPPSKFEPPSQEDLERRAKLRTPKRVPKYYEGPSEQLGSGQPNRKRMPDPPEPPGGAFFCYYISNPNPRNGTVMWMVDEALVHELAERWGEIAGTEEADELAHNYWQGTVRIDPGSIAYLVHGAVAIDGLCTGGRGESSPWRELSDE